MLHLERIFWIEMENAFQEKENALFSKIYFSGIFVFCMSKYNIIYVSI